MVKFSVAATKLQVARLLLRDAVHAAAVPIDRQGMDLHDPSFWEQPLKRRPCLLVFLPLPFGQSLPPVGRDQHDAIRDDEVRVTERRHEVCLLAYRELSQHEPELTRFILCRDRPGSNMVSQRGDR